MKHQKKKKKGKKLQAECIVQKPKSQGNSKGRVQSHDTDLCIKPRLDVEGVSLLSAAWFWGSHRRLPAPSAVGWGARVGACKVVECHLCGILLCIVEVLAIIPEPCCESPPLDRDTAGPSCAAAWWGVSLHRYSYPWQRQRTSAVRNNLEDWRHDLCLAASICHARVSIETSNQKLHTHRSDIPSRRSCQVAQWLW